MALTISISRGFTMTAGYAPTVDDWNAAFLPSVTLSGGIDGGDIADAAITFAKLNSSLILSGTAIATLALDDMLLVGDASAAANRVITVANALTGIFGLVTTAATAFTSYTADRFTFYDGTAAGTMTPARLAEQLVAQAPALTTTDDADEVLVHDASATDGSQATRVTLENLLPNKGTAGAYTGITGVTTDAKGRVTAVTTGSGAAFGGAFKTTGALPTLDGYANGTTVTISPTFGQAAAIVTLDLECTSADLDYSVGDMVPGGKAVIQTNSHPAFTPIWTSADALKVVRSNGTVLMYRKDGASAAGIDTTKWQFRLTAVKYS